MKITGARQEPISSVRPRAAAGGPGASGLGPAAAPARTDGASFLGLTEADMTPGVRAALQTLLAEVDELRGEVGRLKGRLAEVEGLADRDALTPLLNRRAFMRELSRLRTFALRYGSPASLVYFDLDDLKGINDRHGHAGGDAVIQAVAERLAANVRESDIVARIGGDEFAVLLVQADQAVAAVKAEALADAVQRDPVAVGDAQVAIRLSYGLSEITQNAEPEALMAAADSAMYGHKRARRTA